MKLNNFKRMGFNIESWIHIIWVPITQMITFYVFF